MLEILELFFAKGGHYLLSSHFDALVMSLTLFTVPLSLWERSGCGPGPWPFRKGTSWLRAGLGHMGKLLGFLLFLGTT